MKHSKGELLTKYQSPDPTKDDIGLFSIKKDLAPFFNISMWNAQDEFLTKCQKHNPAKNNLGSFSQGNT